MVKFMKLYVLDNGRIENDLACLVCMPHQGFVENKNPPAEWVTVPVYTVLIEVDGKKILFDTACHPDSMTKRWSQHSKSRNPLSMSKEQELPNVLKRLGYEPKDIDIVVMSHLHIDHAGCLEMFTNSQIIANESEFENVMKLYALNADMGAYVRDDIKGWIDAELTWKLVPNEEKVITLAPGVEILNLGSGHVYGMMALKVDLPNTGTVILASDAINLAVNMGPPIRFPGLAYDTIGFKKTVQYIYDVAQNTNADVWFGHDIEQFNALVKSDEGYYD